MLPDRRSSDALLAQARAEPKRLLVLTEGESDRDALAYWAREENVSIDVYHVNDYKIDIAEDLRCYGANKGRIITAIRDIVPKNLKERNLKGIVDRDIDFLLNRAIVDTGIVYTTRTAFPNLVYSHIDIVYIFEVCFRRPIPGNAVAKALYFGRWVLGIKAYLAANNLTGGLPDFARSIDENWDFAFESYVGKLSARNGRVVNLADFEPFLNQIDQENGDFHSLLSFLHTGARKSGLIRDVTLNELYRHFFHRIVIKFEGSDLSEILRALANDLS